MFKRFYVLIALALLSASALAQTPGPNSYLMREIQYDLQGNGMVARLGAFPAPGVKCMRVLDGDLKTTTGPSCLTLGSTFTVTGGVIDVPVTAGPQGATGATGPAGATGATGPAGTTDFNGLTNVPAWISGATPTGQSLMTVSDPAAARAALGAGTSSFSGAYSALTGTPLVFTPAVHTQPWSTITSPPTNCAGYGITDCLTISAAAAAYYPLSSNPAGYLTGINNSQVVAALGITPVSLAQARAGLTLTNTGSGAATYNASTGALNIPTPPSTPARTYNNNVVRSLNTNYTISTTRDVRVSYSINAAWALQALLSGTGAAFLEYSTDGGTNWITVNQVSKTLNLLTVAGGDDMNLVGEAPANALMRIRTTSSNMTVSYVRGQEVLQ